MKTKQLSLFDKPPRSRKYKPLQDFKPIRHLPNNNYKISYNRWHLLNSVPKWIDFALTLENYIEGKITKSQILKYYK